MIEIQMKNVDKVITEALHSDVALINQLSQYIILSGGKRLRPQLALLSALACGYEGNNHTKAAAIIEFIHTATLLHDDVVDTSELRRGKETANAVFGNQAAVLTGDFLYSRAFQMMVEIDNMEVMKVLSDTTNVIAEGEVMQLMHIGEVDLSEQDYYEVIYRKTARLFETSTLLGAVLTNQDDDIKNAMQDYGKHLGNAFQIVDDVLDYQSDSETMGKNAGDDLAEGKMTLPLIYAYQKSNELQKKIIETAITSDDTLRLDDVLEILDETAAFDYAISQAQEQADLACESLTKLPASEYKEGLFEIAKQATKRLT